MANEKAIQVVMLPYHGQGHMNTMLQFAKRLAWKGVHITIVTTTTIVQTMQYKISSWKSITLEPIYDDFGESNLHITARMARFEAEGSSNLAQILIAKKQRNENNKCLLVYHSSLHWALDIAHQNGALGAEFFSYGCTSIACYYSLHMMSQGKDVAELPAMVPNPLVIQGKVPPSFGGLSNTDDKGFHRLVLWLVKDYSDVVRADFVLVNSFYKLEEQVVNWMSNVWPVRTIGPTLPSAYLDRRVTDDIDYGFNQFNPSNEACTKWLDTKPVRSVVYIAFGSVARLSVEQTAELAEALKQSSSNFLWVVRETEQGKLPSNFISETSDKGLVLPWCPQLDVLAHEAVGCFMSHCGWNSTIEALSFGVPVLGMPQFLDQVVDAHLVEQVWGVGITPTPNEDGLVTRNVIKDCLEEIMLGERSEEIKANVVKWKKLAKEALDECGSSDKHIDEIIERLASS